MNLRNNKVERVKSPAGNMWFYESGGVNPQKQQCVIASTSPAASSVAPAFIKPLGRWVQCEEVSLYRTVKI